MKIGFLSENGYSGKVDRMMNNCRTEYAWQIALDAVHMPMYGKSQIPTEKLDLLIWIIPKSNISKMQNLDWLVYMRLHANKIAIMQEGPHWYFQDLPMGEQIWFYNQLNNVDYVFCHNEYDRKYYSGLLGTHNVHTMQSLMILDTVKDGLSDTKEDVIIGGNMKSWYGGFDSYIVAREFDTEIYAPSMGRRAENESDIAGIFFLNYMSWTTWIKKLSEFKYAVHLMRTFAAGTFAMNCSYLGIPCIGYNGLDTQSTLHPLTTVEVGDMEKAIQLANNLKEDRFYNLCVETTKKRFNKYYTEQAFIDKWDKYNL